jgi:hyperosmotically inducible protein
MRRVLFLFAVLAFASTFLVACSHVTGETAGQGLDDSVITSDIKAKIVKDSELKTFGIGVSTYQGNVTLSGQVPNSAAEQRLIQYAQDTKGVKSVKTNLRMVGPTQGRTGTMPPTGETMSAPGTTPGPGESSRYEEKTTTTETMPSR